MSCYLPPLRLTGARILRDGELQARSLSLAEGRLTRGPFQEIDLRGFLILPGIVDLHCDSLERAIRAQRPDPSARRKALAAMDRDTAANGVTTAFLTQRWSWEGALRGPDAAEAVLAALDAHRRGALTDLRIQLRSEAHLVAPVARLLAAVERFRVGYVVFNDHLEEAQRRLRHAPADLAAWADAIDAAPAALLANLEVARTSSAEVARALCAMAETFDRLGVVYGSHGDPDGETREYHAMIGARIAEFPRSKRVALAAQAMMCPVILGAPDVLGGGARSCSAEDLVAAGHCNALVSGDQPSSPARAAWALVDRGVLPLPRAWALVSQAPAEILRLADRGRLQPGLRADLVVMNAETRIIEATISAGRLSYLAGEAGRRFAAHPTALALAAE